MRSLQDWSIGDKLLGESMHDRAQHCIALTTDLMMPDLEMVAFPSFATRVLKEDFWSAQKYSLLCYPVMGALALLCGLRLYADVFGLDDQGRLVDEVAFETWNEAEMAMAIGSSMIFHCKDRTSPWAPISNAEGRVNIRALITRYRSNLMIGHRWFRVPP